MIVQLLIEHHLEFLGLKGGCRGSSESTHVKMPHCWKCHAAAQISSIHNDKSQDGHDDRNISARLNGSTYVLQAFLVDRDTLLLNCLCLSVKKQKKATK